MKVKENIDYHEKGMTSNTFKTNSAKDKAIEYLSKGKRVQYYSQNHHYIGLESIKRALDIAIFQSKLEERERIKGIIEKQKRQQMDFDGEWDDVLNYAVIIQEIDKETRE